MGSLLFDIFVNDIDEETKCGLSKIGDDTNLSGMTDTPQ